MSVYDNIRAALEVTLNNITDIPDIQFQNTRYSPTTGSPFIIASFVPTSRRPSEVGSNPFNRYQGIFNLQVHTDENKGPSENQTICNKILEAYPAGTHDIVFNGQIVRVEYVEQSGSSRSSPWYVTPINVGWYAYDKD